MKRGNNTGSIYFERSRKRWCVAFTIENGKRSVKRFKTRQEAVAFLEDTNTAMRCGERIVDQNLSLGDWLITYVTTYKRNRVKYSTYNSYLGIMRMLSPLAEIKINSESGINVQKFFNRCGYAKTTKRALARFVSMALKKAVSLGLASKNFMDTVELDLRNNNSIKVFTLDELRRIDKQLRTTNLYPIFLIAIYTGMRPGEIYALSWEDINLKEKTISVKKNVYAGVLQDTPKTAHSLRTISIGGRLTSYLESYKRKNKNRNFLFTTDDGKFKNSAYLKRTWTLALQKAGVPYRKFYCLRHTHASILLANGMPITDVSARLGHSTSAITLSVYAHYIPGHEKGIVKNIDSYLQ